VRRPISQGSLTAINHDGKRRWRALHLIVVLLLASRLGSAGAQSLPNIRTTFVPRLPALREPDIAP